MVEMLRTPSVLVNIGVYLIRGPNPGIQEQPWWTSLHRGALGKLRVRPECAAINSRRLIQL